MTNTCSLKREGITLYDQVRISCSTRNTLVQTIPLNTGMERICYGFNHSQCCQAYTKQSAYLQRLIKTVETLSVPQSALRQKLYSDGHLKRL